MATELEYALMAGGSYISTRSDDNQFSIPAGWIEFKHETTGSGFEAVSFQNGNEVVISYAGTLFLHNLRMEVAQNAYEIS
ncbi:hypothetical protein [Methylobacter sp.]|uniref:hypothetical protein n=1 Tax=Methylobacter sp. TaxID=2051955 RepID=UPI00248A267C|nr:hypothetical protein [Methylobacter sp.]MDI1279647.1 hypothetical protein [Methylobacter sp.]MDI1360316.1 hypothetical protein [Methylobacter sp.]